MENFVINFFNKLWGKNLWKSSKSKNWENCKKSVKIIFSHFFRWKFSDKIFVFGRKFSLFMIFLFFHHFILESLKVVIFCLVFVRFFSGWKFYWKFLEIIFVILKFYINKSNQFIWRKFLRVMMDFLCLFNGFSVSRKIIIFSI